MADGRTWNEDPNQRGMLLDQQLSRKGSSCEAPGAIGFDATAIVKASAEAGTDSVLLALGSAEGERGNVMTRKHYDWASRLTISYNSRPDVPMGASMVAPSRACSANPAEPSYVNGAQAITLQVTATDPDAQNVAANFFLRTGATGADRVLSTTALQAQGSALRATIPAKTLTEGQLYGWSAEASDYIQVSASRTPVCYFVVDSTKPGLPAIAIDSAATTVSEGTYRVPTRVGEPVTVRVTPPADGPIAGYQVWWTMGAKTQTSPPAPVTDYTTALPVCEQNSGPARVVCADTAGAAVFQVAPPSTTATLWVAAYDRAGNVSFAAGTASVAAGITVHAGGADLGSGHLWMPAEAAGTTVDDSIGSTPLTVGTFAGWREDGGEDPQIAFPALATLNRYVAANWTHHTEVEASRVPATSRLEMSLGQVVRAIPGSTPPAGTTPLYACAWGSGNMLSNTSNCEGTNVSARLIGHAWRSAADVPHGMTATEVFRCRLGNDYFVSAQRSCEGQVFEGSKGFVATAVPTVSAAPVVDTMGSYSVSARVKPASVDGIQSVLATTGATDSAFYLRVAEGVWQFCVRSQGVTKVTRCVDGPQAQAGRFVSVTGTWDAVNRQLSVNVLDGSSFARMMTHANLPADDIPSTGVLTVGSARLSGAPAYSFNGSVADVAVYPIPVPESLLRQYPVPMP